MTDPFTEFDLSRLPREGGVSLAQRGGGDGERQGDQVHRDQRHHRLGAGGGECPPDRHVERPLQPQDLQLLLRDRRGAAEHQVHPGHAALLVQADDRQQAGPHIPAGPAGAQPRLQT